MHITMERMRNYWAVVRDILTLLGGIGGLAALVWVGAQSRQIEVNTKRLDKVEKFIEETGSPTLLAHMKSDEQRWADYMNRMMRLEDTAKMVTEMKGDVGVLRALAEERKADLVDLKQALKELKDKVR